MERYKQRCWHLSALQGMHVEVQQPNPFALRQMQERGFAVLAPFPSSQMAPVDAGTPAEAAGGGWRPSPTAPAVAGLTCSLCTLQGPVSAPCSA